MEVIVVQPGERLYPALLLIELPSSDRCMPSSLAWKASPPTLGSVGSRAYSAAHSCNMSFLACLSASSPHPKKGVPTSLKRAIAPWRHSRLSGRQTLTRTRPRHHGWRRELHRIMECARCWLRREERGRHRTREVRMQSWRGSGGQLWWNVSGRLLVVAPRCEHGVLHATCLSAAIVYTIHFALVSASQASTLRCPSRGRSPSLSLENFAHSLPAPCLCLCPRYVFPLREIRLADFIVIRSQSLQEALRVTGNA